MKNNNIIVLKGNKVYKQKSGAQITGEKIPGDLDGWEPYIEDINAALKLSYGDLQKRSLSLFHSYPPLASAINKTTAYAIGPGLVFRSQPDWRILGITPDQAKEWGKKFQALVHYKSTLVNWYDKQSILFRGAAAGGDSLLYFIRENNKPLDLVEAGGYNINWEKSDDNYTLGIKHDKYLRRKAIFTDKEISFKDENGDQNVIQFYIKDLPRQLRGTPVGYKIIALAKNHDRELDATVQRTVIESMMVGYSQTETTDMRSQMQNQANNAKAAKKEGSILQRIGNALKLGAGNFYQLKTGEDIKFTDPKTPGNNFAPFNEWMIKFVAMGTDTTPGIIMSEYPTSYTSHKGQFNDFWKMVLLKRRAFEHQVCKVVIKEFLKEFILEGLISAPGFFDNEMMQEAWLAGMFLGPVPGVINPLQEVNAWTKAVEQAFVLRSDVASLYGNEWSNMIDEWMEETAIFNNRSSEEKEEIIQEEMTNNNQNDSNSSNNEQQPTNQEVKNNDNQQ